MRSFQNYSRTIVVFIALGDLVFCFLAYSFSFWIRSKSTLFLFQDTIPLHRFFNDYNHHSFIPVLGLQIFLLYTFGLYDRLKQSRFIEVVRFTSSAISLQVLFLISFYYFMNDILFPRSIFVVFWLINISLVTCWRIMITRVLKVKGGSRRVLIVGTSERTKLLIQEIERLKTIGLLIIGIVPHDHSYRERSFLGYPILGNPEQLLDLIEEHRINEVILTKHMQWDDKAIAQISLSEKTQARISVVPSIYEIMVAQLHHLKIHDIPLVEILREPASTITKFGKKIMDISLGCIGLLTTVFIFPIVALLIKVSSPGPVFFRQERVGKDETIYTLIKFRTMVDNAEKESGPVLPYENDARITKVGHYLRQWRIDEMPQFWNVLKGEMSLVGPRPERFHFVEQFKETIPGYSIRFKIKPGMTGLAQVNGSNLTSAENKFRYDLAYIYNQSLWLDIVIIMETMKVIVTGRVT